MQLPDVLINYIKEFLPPHPLQKEISSWTRKQYFHKWYFNKHSSKSKKKNIDRFVKDNIFWIKMNGTNNEDAIKLKHKCKLDKIRMILKLKELKLELYEVGTTTHIPRLNKYGNYSEVYFNNQEIVY